MNSNPIEIIAFWRPIDPHNYLGQWYMSDFQLTEEMIEEFPEQIKSMNLLTDKLYVIQWLAASRYYNCTEKFMMMGKAALFGDKETFNKMERSVSPKAHKSLGRLVQNYDETDWQTYCKDIVTIGNYLKFTQNEDLRTLLLNTGTATLVEGSPIDNLWGVGIRFDDPLIRYKKHWKGKNYLGLCLEAVRNMLYVITKTTDHKKT